MNCKKLLCYLNNDARAAYDKLIAAGVDSELAFVMVESIGGEEVYDLNDDAPVDESEAINGQATS